MPTHYDEFSYSAKLFNERKARVDDAVSLREPDRVPIIPLMGSAPFHLYGSNYEDAMYAPSKAQEANLAYHRDFQPDIGVVAGCKSGKANEIAGSTMIDWPGRPGTSVPYRSSFQVIEQEYLLEDEYSELLKDYTGFMIRKYIPRAYSNLTGLSRISFVPMVVLGSDFLSPLYSPEAMEAFASLEKIGIHEAEMNRVTQEYATKLIKMGFPPYFIMVAEAPFDVLGDYFRGTVGVLTDLEYRPDNVLAACNIFADKMISAFTSLKGADLLVKRVLFPLHKGMDSFMNNEKYERFYWQPFKRIISALVDMGVTPFIYSEGSYNSRLEILADVPKGKVIYHFQDVDMARAKKTLGNTACITGNIPHYLLEHGSKEEVEADVKRLIDTCAAGGGYMLDTDMVLDNCKRENLEVMFDTCKSYGKK